MIQRRSSTEAGSRTDQMGYSIEATNTYPSDEEALVNALGYLQRLDNMLSARRFNVKVDLLDNTFSLLGLCVHHLLFQKCHEHFLFKMMIYRDRITDNSIAAGILVFKEALRLNIQISKLDNGNRFAEAQGSYWAFQVDGASIFDLRTIQTNYEAEIKEVYNGNLKPTIYKLISEMMKLNSTYSSNFSIQRTLQRHGPFSITLKV